VNRTPLLRYPTPAEDTSGRMRLKTLSTSLFFFGKFLNVSPAFLVPRRIAVVSLASTTTPHRRPARLMFFFFSPVRTCLLNSLVLLVFGPAYWVVIFKSAKCCYPLSSEATPLAVASYDDYRRNLPANDDP